MAPSGSSPPSAEGLSSFRRAGRVTEVLFLYEVALHRHARLRPIARELGITVQAASQLNRALEQRGWTQLVEGNYVPTVRGIAALHEALISLRTDLDDRLGRLRVVTRCRAVAARPLRKGQRVVLRLEDGLLVAVPGDRGPSRGRTMLAARRGDLVEVEELEGILPLRPHPVRCLVLPTRPLPTRRAGQEVAQELRRSRYGLVAAEGLEAYHLLQRATALPVVRFGVASVCREAAQMGVPVLVVVAEERLPAFLQKLSDPTPVAEVEVETLGEA
ncbi:MAG: hypothetical protein KGJ23_13735 [Euryarchaeota archaeon]|nr:hypothetical protein [Euryarchaeota archaeon]MDE2046275.1 hypothetical protein [Thermoplasmata archaeon]